MSDQIDSDTTSLVEIVDLFRRGLPLAEWPIVAQAVMALALHDEHATPTETAKARRLQRHLFGDLPPPAFVRDAVQSRRAERVRADLPGIVAFGSGLHLTDPAAIARAWLTTAA